MEKLGDHKEIKVDPTQVEVGQVGLGQAKTMGNPPPLLLPSYN